MYSFQLFFEAFEPFTSIIIAGAVFIVAMLIWNCFESPEE